MFEWFKTEFQWMYWTWPSVIFFIMLFLSIAGLTIWDVFSPGIQQKGFLPISTTRGDRFFIGIISTIGLFLLWFLIAGNTLFVIAVVLSIFLNIILARWG